MVCQAYASGSASGAHIAMLTVRHPLPLEPLPPSLPHELGYSFYPPQPDWVWIVCETDNKPIALLVAAPVQNLVFLMRICAATQEAQVGASALMLLLRSSLADMAARGYKAYCVCLDPKRPIEARLIEFVKGTGNGNSSIIEGMSLAVGPTEIGAW